MTKMKTQSYKFISIMALTIISMVYAFCQRKMIIEPFKAAEEARGANKWFESKRKPGDRKSKVDYFLVDNFYDSDTNCKHIDDYVCSNLDSNYREYKDYFVHVFRKTRITNPENIAKNPTEIANHSEIYDLLFVYKWYYGNQKGKKHRHLGEQFPIKTTDFECE